MGKVEIVDNKLWLIWGGKSRFKGNGFEFEVSWVNLINWNNWVWLSFWVCLIDKIKCFWIINWKVLYFGMLFILDSGVCCKY